MADKQDKLAAFLATAVNESAAIKDLTAAVKSLHAGNTQLETTLNAILVRLGVLESLFNTGDSAGEKRAPRSAKKTGTTTTTTTTTAKTTKPVAKMNVTQWAMMYNWEKAVEEEGVKVGALSEFLCDTSRDAIANAKALQKKPPGSEDRLRSEGRLIYMKATDEGKEKMQGLKKEWEDGENVDNMTEPLENDTGKK